MANVQFKLVPVDYTKPYNEQPDCKRHVIGAYANLARHNMTVTINVIMQAIGMPLFDENDIADAFNKSHRKKLAELDNIHKVNLQNRLYRHFPFFKRMKLEDETKKSVQLNTLLEVMADFTSCMAMIRNFYTHYHPYNSPTEQSKQLELKKVMGKRLQYLYENTSQFFKTNEKLDHEGNEVFAALRVRDNTGNVKRFVRNPDYPAYMMDERKGMSDIAIIYFLCLFLEKKVSFELMEEVGLTKQIKFKGKDADRQVLFVKEILCMNRIRMTKTKLDSEMTDTALALDMINELRKCPKPLYEVLSKDARDEFKDDSTVLWEKEHGKEAIDTEDNSEEKDVASEKDTPRSTFVRWEDRFPQMALRYIDLKGMFNDIRFQLNLGKYRFAFYQHDKQYSVDNEERLRILQKELHGFGRIQEVDVEMQNLWQNLFEKKYEKDGLLQKEPDMAGQAPYVTEQKPQYAIDEKSHNIGLRWEGWDNNCRQSSNVALIEQHLGNKEKKGLDKKKMFIPYLPETPLQEEKHINHSEPLLPPQAMLSLYELPGLLFYQYLLAKQGKDKYIAEQFIKDYYTNIRLFLDDFAKGSLKQLEGVPVVDIEKQEALWEQRKADLNTQLAKYKIKENDIPSKLRDFLCNKETDNEQKLLDSALNRVEEKKKRVQNALNSYKEKKKKIGTKENKYDKMRATIKTGQLAQWLIRDIWDWLPNNSKSRKTLTGQSYAVLQTAISMLGQKFSDSVQNELNITMLQSYFVKAGIIPKTGEIKDVNNHHPFLRLVFEKSEMNDSVEVFYEKYIETELLHIEDVNKQLREGKDYDDYYRVPFLHCDRSRWDERTVDSLRNLAKRYLDKPLQLPNGMFAKPIYDLLSEEKNMELYDVLMATQQGLADKKLDRNTSYLISQYFHHIEGDGSQPFYNTTIKDGYYRHIYRVFKKYYDAPKSTIEEIRVILNNKESIKTKIKAIVDVKVSDYKRELNGLLRDYEDELWAELKMQVKDRKRKWDTEEFKQEVKQKSSERKELYLMKYRELLTRKQLRLFKKVENNERTIRRFKTQDILLLIMAREILKAKSQDEDFTQGFNLKFVMTDSLLDKPVDFDWNVNIEKKKKNEDGKIEKETIKKTIRQEGMKMKNYGQFYKFASDHQRLESLLSRLPQDIFQRAEIENEFSYYDTNRSEVFRQVYIIESEAYKLKPDLEIDANAKDENDWFWYTDKKGKKHPKRNNFLSLLEILAAGNDGVLNEKEKRSLQSTRNAFGHNTYDVDLTSVFDGKSEKMKVPEIANGIKDKIKEQTNELIQNLNR